MLTHLPHLSVDSIWFGMVLQYSTVVLYRPKIDPLYFSVFAWVYLCACVCLAYHQNTRLGLISFPLDSLLFSTFKISFHLDSSLGRFVTVFDLYCVSVDSPHIDANICGTFQYLSGTEKLFRSKFCILFSFFFLFRYSVRSMMIDWLWNFCIFFITFILISSQFFSNDFGSSFLHSLLSSNEHWFETHYVSDIFILLICAILRKGKRFFSILSIAPNNFPISPKKLILPISLLLTSSTALEAFDIF